MAIAQNRGLFEKHGVNVEPVFYTTYSEQLSDFSSNVLDGALLTLTDALLLEAKRPGSSRVILITDYSDGQDKIVATEAIQRVADLRGQGVGASQGSFGEMLVRQMLNQNDMTFSDITLVNIGPEEIPDQLGQDIVAGHTWGPDLARAEEVGAHVIFSSADTPGLIADIFLVQDQLVEERAEELQACVDAWFEALAWWQANPAEANAIIAEVIGVAPAEVSAEGVRLLNQQDNVRAFTAGRDISLHENGRISIQFLASVGSFTTAPDLEQLLDSSFIEE
jgi:NitT/TauT family transport system substrate-binding protein